MIKRIIAFGIAFAMIICAGCSNEGSKKVQLPDGSGASDSQYVLAMNPAVILPDGTVKTAARDISVSMSEDLGAETTSALYENTGWQWIYSSDGAGWNRRQIRALETWKDKEGKSPKGAVYSYSLNNNRTTSLAVYDTSMIEISGYSDGDIASQGILFTAAGNETEALAYTVDSDCVVDFYDPDGGSVSLVSAVAGSDTDRISDGEKFGVVLKLYRNGRTLWQDYLGSSELLGEEKTSVPFPSLSGIEMLAGDTLIFTVQAVEESDGLETGYIDIPSGTEIIKRPVTTEQQVEITQEPADEAITSIPFINDSYESTFTIIRPADADAETVSVISNLRDGMMNSLGVFVNYKSDETDTDDYAIYVYNTNIEESASAISEIESGRENHDADFIIRAYGKKIVIAASAVTGLEFAIEYFLDKYCTDSNSELPANVNYISSQHNKLNEIRLSGSDISEYRIVVSRFASFIETSAAKYLIKEISRLTGTELKMVQDYIPKTGNEILVGKTNRTSDDYSKIAYSVVTNDYDISVSGGTVALIGNQEYGTNAAAIKFVELLNEQGSLRSGFTFSGQYDGGYTLTDGYKLTWSDEFNTGTRSRTWKATTSVTRGDSYLGGDTYNVASNVRFGEGTMDLHAYVEGNDVYNAYITSEGPEAMWHKYGYAEVRVKFSTTQGVSNTFWTKGPLVDTFLETDIFENFGNPYNAKCNLHTWNTVTGEHVNILGGTGGILNNSPGTTVPEPYGYDYHTFGWEWSDNRINFYYDGVLNVTFDCSSEEYDCFDRACYYIISTDICSPSYGTLPEEGVIVNDFTSYDWFRLYQKADDGSTLIVKK